MLALSQVQVFGDNFGAAAEENPNVKGLQQFLYDKGKLAQNRVTGQMNGDTVAAIHTVLVAEAGRLKDLAIIDFLPYASKVKTTLGVIKSALNSVDTILNRLPSLPVIGKLTFAKIFGNVDEILGTLQSAVIPGLELLGRSSEANTVRDLVNKVAEVRDKLYREIGDQSGRLLKALPYIMGFMAPPSGGTTFPGGGTTSTTSSTGTITTGFLLPVGGKTRTPGSSIPGAMPASPAVRGKYAGCVYRFNVTRKKFMIYCAGPVAGLGESPPTDAAGNPLKLTAEVDTVEETAGAKDGGQESDPLYKRPWFWVATIGGVAVAGTAGYMIVRRSKKPAGLGRYQYRPYRMRYSRGLPYRRTGW